MMRALRGVWGASVFAAGLIGGCGLALDLDPPDPPRLVDGGMDMAVPECEVSAECNDGLFCNGIEQCVSGSCVSVPIQCAPDATDCTVERCDETLDDCVSVPNDELCTDPLVCMPGTGCVPPRVCDDATDCDDGDHCNGVETCGGNGQCVAGTAVTCTAVGCRSEGRCNPDNGTCEFTFDDDACNNDDDCDGVETCDPSGACTNPPDVVCDDAGQCGVGECNPSGGTCSIRFDDGLCGDGWDCTRDRCDTGTCVHEPVDSVCADEHACTVDRCAFNPTLPPFPSALIDAAGCIHAPDDTVCEGRGTTCFVGVCAPGAVSHDEDGCAVRVDTTACTNNTRCGPSGQCEPLPLVDIIAGCATNNCDDGNPCNGTEICVTAGLLCQAGTGGCPVSSDPCAQPFCDTTNAGGAPVCATRRTAACFTGTVGMNP